MDVQSQTYPCSPAPAVTSGCHTCLCCSPVWKYQYLIKGSCARILPNHRSTRHHGSAGSWETGAEHDPLLISEHFFVRPKNLRQGSLKFTHEKSSFGFQLNFFLHWGFQRDQEPAWRYMPPPSIVFVLSIPSTSFRKRSKRNKTSPPSVKKTMALEYQLYQSG